jgi:hypothetical protein
MRFTTKKHSDDKYSVFDTLAKQYDMPEMAVSIYFKTNACASKVASSLNREWNRFLSRFLSKPS